MNVVELRPLALIPCHGEEVPSLNIVVDKDVRTTLPSHDDTGGILANAPSQHGQHQALYARDVLGDEDRNF